MAPGQRRLEAFAKAVKQAEPRLEQTKAQAERLCEGLKAAHIVYDMSVRPSLSSS